MKLTKSEMEIMEVLWGCNKPQSRADLLAAPHTFKDSSIHIILNGLLKKGVICTVGVVKCGKTWGRTFGPAITPEKYWAQLIYNGGKGPRLCGEPDLFQLALELAERSSMSRSEFKAILHAVEACLDEKED